MEAQSSHTPAQKGFMSRLTALAPNAKFVDKLQVQRSKRHALEDAQRNVAEKLRRGVAKLRDPSGMQLTDSPIRKESDGTYAVGIKYGNRWLHGVFNGKTHIAGLSAEDACLIAEDAAQAVLDGEFDEEIKSIMADNIAAAVARRR